MPTYRILLSKQVAIDLDEIFAHIAKNSPRNAARVVDRILNALEGLKTFPHRSIARGRSRRGVPVRSLPVQSWLIFFRVFDDERMVRVLRVRHGSRRRPRRFD